MNNICDASYGLFINNEFVPSSDGKTFATVCPANGEKLADVSAATPEDVDRAVKVATEAFKTWSKTSPAERAALLLKIADAIDANVERLATVEMLDNGKPFRETRNIDIPAGADHFRYFAGVLRAAEGRAAQIDENTLSLVLHEPARRCGSDHSVELPVPDGLLEARPGARCRRYGSDQAGF